MSSIGMTNDILFVLKIHFLICSSSETVRCELAKDPHSKVDGVQTEDGIGGRKLIVSGGI